MDRAVVLIMFVVNATEQVEAYRVIMNNERRKHTVINSIRQFDRASVAMLLMMHSACIPRLIFLVTSEVKSIAQVVKH